jgi:hypothetical protein
MATSPVPPDAMADASPVAIPADQVADPIPPRSAGGDVPLNDATGSFKSPPRQDWPCAFRERYESDAEWRVTERFVYGKRMSCRLPISFVDAGIVGCVERSVVEHGGKHYGLRLLRYGTNGNLEFHDSNFGPQVWSWEKDVPTPSDAIAIERSPGRLSASLGGTHVVDVDAAGRPMRTWSTDRKNVLESRCEYTWQGSRFIAKQCFGGSGEPNWRYEPMYECSHLPKLTASVNKGGALGIPLSSP